MSEEAAVSIWNDPPGGFHPVSTPDYLPRRQLAAIQLQRLQSVVARAYDRVPLFKSRMAERKLSPASIGSLADIAKLPFSDDVNGQSRLLMRRTVHDRVATMLLQGDP